MAENSHRPPGALFERSLAERERLRDLFSLDVLNTQPGERLNRYTRLVARVFDVPMALVSLVDGKRQWFKALVGIELNDGSLDDSFCRYAVDGDLLEVHDARLDPRFANNPLVTGRQQVRFYAGAVLRGPTGRAMGTLCILDRKPGALTDEQRHQLAEFAALLEQELIFNVELGKARDEMSRSLLRDPLTELAGPLLLEEQADKAIEALKGDAAVAAVHLQVRNLDDINRVYGREAGDMLLRAVATRLQECVPGAIETARLSGARFVLLQHIEQGGDGLEPAVNRIADWLARDFTLQDHVVHPDLVLGVASAPRDALQGDILIEKARYALRDIERGGEQRLKVYSADTEERLARHKRIAFRLPAALEDAALSVAYQPLFGPRSRRIQGVEALVRWQDPELGAVTPDEFIPLTETDVRLSRLLTHFVLRTACRDTLAWGQPDLRLAVNISARELYRQGFVDFIATTLADEGFPPERLTLELTEQSLITDAAHAARTLGELGAKGVRFAIDDFGTGYSSLSYLRRLPVHTLKIDRSFVTEIATDATAWRLASGIVEIGRSLNLGIVAEGIETEEQLVRLRDLGCDSVQGFYLGRPEPAAAIGERLGSAPG